MRTENALLLVAAVRQELRRAGVEAADVGAFTAEALAGDEEHLRTTCSEWVDLADDEGTELVTDLD